MKRKVEIDDTLQERVDAACDDVKDVLLRYLASNPGTDELPDLSNDLDYDGSIHEIVDGSVPIYTAEIDDTWYLYANELEEAYENAGIGDNSRENFGMTAVYCYIYEKVVDWYMNNGQEIFDEWLDAKQPD